MSRIGVVVRAEHSYAQGNTERHDHGQHAGPDQRDPPRRDAVGAGGDLRASDGLAGVVGRAAALPGDGATQRGRQLRLPLGRSSPGDVQPLGRADEVAQGGRGRDVLEPHGDDPGGAADRCLQLARDVRRPVGRRREQENQGGGSRQRLEDRLGVGLAHLDVPGCDPAAHAGALERRHDLPCHVRIVRCVADEHPSPHGMNPRAARGARPSVSRRSAEARMAGAVLTG